MAHRMSVRLLIAGFALLMISVLARAEPTRRAYLLDIDGAIGPAASDYLSRAMEKAQAARAELIILRIDTPGGLVTSMRAIIKDILASSVPVVSFVAPGGARAASAGTYIMYASHVAAMAPATNLGAATPVRIGGGSPFPAPGRDDGRDKKGAKKGTKEYKAPSSSMEKKIVNDAVAYIRGLAQMRGRNEKWAEKAVREAASLPARDALRKKVIDVIAADIDELLTKIDGRKVSVLGKSRQLDTAGLTLVALEHDWRSKLLGVITNPNVAYILMLIGIYGLLMEFYNPGVLVPGVIGGISLLLALYAFHVLPINYAGLGLILLGLTLMIAEAFVPSIGILGLGGATAFVIGSVLLLDADVPGYTVSPVLVGTIAAFSAGGMLLVMTMFMRARRRPVVSGPDVMIGSTARVIEWSGREGKVHVNGEIWNASANAALTPESKVQVVRVEGLTLIVQPQTERS